jgi:hypothetical protein
MKYALSGHFQGTEYDPYGKSLDPAKKGIYRPIGVNRTDFMSLVQLRPYVPAEIAAVQWICYGSNVFNAFVPFYANVNATPEYLANTTGRVSTGNFYWSSRLIGALADAQYAKTAIHIERYQNAVLSMGHYEIGRVDAEIEEAYREVSPELLDVIRKALVNIRDYHAKQVPNSWFDSKDGIILGQKVTALENVGVYVPGGKAVYPSSVLMNIVPAKVAGVDHIYMCTPCDANGKVYASTLVAAKEAGADKIFKVGGAQAIAAMAFGTKSIPKVDKIVGPGNIYVALAKKAVFGHVSIDSIAGPSEILVLADETANPRYVAADLLSQAEHDELASAILVTTSRSLAEQVSKEIDGFLEVLSRRDII